MNEKLIKHITDENASLKNNVGNLADEVKVLSETNETLTKENQHVNTELVKLEEANKVIEGYGVHGTSEEIKEKLDKATKNKMLLGEYKALGRDPKRLKESIEENDAFVKMIGEEFGTTEEIEKALITSIEFKESVDHLGSVEEITEALTTLTNIVESKENEETDARVIELAEELNLEEEKVSELLGKYSEKDIRDLYKSVKPVDEDKDDSGRYSKKRFNEDKREDKKEDKGEFSESRILSGSRITRINESLSNK